MATGVPKIIHAGRLRIYKHRAFYMYIFSSVSRRQRQIHSQSVSPFHHRDTVRVYFILVFYRPCNRNKTALIEDRFKKRNPTLQNKNAVWYMGRSPTSKSHFEKSLFFPIRMKIKFIWVPGNFRKIPDTKRIHDCSGKAMTPLSIVKRSQQCSSQHCFFCISLIRSSTKVVA